MSIVQDIARLPNNLKEPWIVAIIVQVHCKNGGYLTNILIKCKDEKNIFIHSHNLLIVSKKKRKFALSLKHNFIIQI